MTERLPAGRRVLLKLSGEALAGPAGFGLDPEVLNRVAAALAGIMRHGVQPAVVIGGGNLLRGAALQARGLDRVVGDQMGMLATVMNGMALRDALRRCGVRCTQLSAHGIPSMVPQYAADRGRELLAAGECVIVSGGTGAPFFTTDTAAVLRAAELNCAVVLKATKVDGVYTADPQRDPTARRYDRLTYKEALARELKIMDLTAFALARDRHLPIRVFALADAAALERAAVADAAGTLVSD